MRAKNPEDLATIARQRRLDLGVSQADLAQQAGVTRQWLVRFEQGNTQVALSKVFAILRQLGLRVSVDAVTPNGQTARSTRAIFDVPRVTIFPQAVSEVIDQVHELVKNVAATRDHEQ